MFILEEEWVEPSTNTSLSSSLSDDQQYHKTRDKVSVRRRNPSRARSKGVIDPSKSMRNVPMKLGGGDGKMRIDNRDNKIDQYIALIEELTLDTVKTFHGVALTDYINLLNATNGLSIRAKFTYLPESEELHVMSPSPLHESSLIHLSSVVHNFIHNLCVPSGILTIELNTKIEHPIPMIPDFLCALTHRPADYAVKWVGEVSFTVSPTATRQKVKNLLANAPTIDLAFIVYIAEDRKRATPDEEDPKAIQLRSRGLIPRAEFLAPFLADNFYNAVEVGGFKWVSLESVSEVFLRHPNDGFDLESSDEEYVARGELYPSRNMECVSHLFNAGAQRLKESVITLLESNYTDPTSSQALKLQRIRDSDATLDIDRDDWATFISQRLCCTAYDRYYQWYMGPSLKRKNPFYDTRSRRQTNPPSQTTSQLSNSRSRESSGNRRGKRRAQDG